jgi:hypothetical protein
MIQGLNGLGPTLYPSPIQGREIYASRVDGLGPTLYPSPIQGREIYASRVDGHDFKVLYNNICC